jgi:hypothetical protein
MLHELRLLYTFENWLSLIININLIYSNVLARTPTFLVDLLTANQELGLFFSEELKRLHFRRGDSSVDPSSDELLQVYD